MIARRFTAPLLVLAGSLIIWAPMGCSNGKAPSENSESEEISRPPAEVINIDVAQFDKMRAYTDNVILLDVRTPEEIAEGKVPEALELDYNGGVFEQKVGTLDKNKRYLVYCRSGGRSAEASQMMIDLGFRGVYNVLGGYTAWSEAHQEKQ